MVQVSKRVGLGGRGRHPLGRIRYGRIVSRAGLLARVVPMGGEESV
jgi:hypothetical protein